MLWRRWERNGDKPVELIVGMTEMKEWNDCVHRG